MTSLARPVHEITLTNPQWSVFNDPARFRVLVAGRRFGKTYLSCAELARAAMSKKNAVCWYVAPTYRMAKEIAWDHLKATVPRAHLARSPNETELSVRLINGSKIALKGADNPDSLRGLGLDFVVPDEFAMLDKGLWEMVLEPALSDRQGRALFVGTPMGFNWAYDLYLGGINNAKPSWKSWQFTTLDGGNVPPEEIEAKRSSMDPRAFRQEFEASFESLHGRVYDSFSRVLNVGDGVKDTGGELLIGQDFNVNPMTSIIAVRSADELHILDALEINTSNTEETAQEIRRRYPKRTIVVCPDPSGKARKTSAPVGITDFTILQRFGFQIDAPNQAPLVVDRVNAVNAMLCDATGRRRLKIHPRCTSLIKALDGQTYKPGTSIPDKTLGLDHPVDGLGYLVWQRFNLLANRAATVSSFHI